MIRLRRAEIKKTYWRRSAAVVMALLIGGPVMAASPKIGDPPEASNMRLVGFNDLQGRSAYQPTIHHQGDRWIAYIGHHGGTDAIPKPINPLTGQLEFNGTSIVDVTDPAHPVYLRHLPGQEGNYEGGGAQMTRVCDGKALPKGDPSAVYLLRTFGGAAHEIWNVADPANPKLIIRLEGLKDTHKSWWECNTGIAFLVSGVPNWRVRRMTEIYDLSDPAKPIKIREFGLPGQEPGSTGNVPTELHGMMSTGPAGNRVYFGYGTNKGGVLQIVDRDKLINGPKEPTSDNLRFPVIGQMDMSPLNGAHTTFPLGKMTIPNFSKDKFASQRNIVMIVDESLVNECQEGEARQMVWFVDATVEAKPMVVASYSVPPSLQNVGLASAYQEHSEWVETKWPFLMDQWGEGKAFQCKAAECGAELNLYIRAKIGFCSSTTGIADDNELERLSDFDFMKGHVTALGDGHEIDIARMKGRLRAYLIDTVSLSHAYAFSVAFNSNSDALVATVVLNGGNPATMEPVIIQFLNGEAIQRWVTRTLGL